jgi:hypothetical protein
VPIATAQAVGELVLLVVGLLPLGACLLRVGEHLVGRRFRFSVPERALLAFYASGAVLFVVASLPFGLYGLPLVSGLLGAGAISYGYIAFRESAAGLRSAFRFALSPAGGILVLGSVGLLVLEVSPITSVLLPNMWDGSATSLWINLTLANHELPWTLEPIAAVGVVYPLGTTVWMTVPVLLFTWPIAAAPLWLPPLFLSLSAPAAYCWGSRLGSLAGLAPAPVGIVWASFFSLIAAFPRLFLGGSYDFAFALPLWMITLGWLPEWFGRTRARAGEIVLLGLVVGTLTSLSAVAAESLVVVFGVGALVYAEGDLRRGLRALGAVVAAGAFGAGFAARSLLGYAIWYSYPQHVLSPAGSPPYVVAPSLYPFGPRLVLGELDPFVPWKPKLSPFPYLALEIQILLALGLLLVVLGWTWADSRWAGLVPSATVRALSVSMVGTLLMTVALTAAAVPGSPLSALGTISSLGEASVLWFIALEAVALLPILAVYLLLAGRPTERAERSRSTVPSRRTVDPPRLPGASGRSRALVLALGILLAVPLGSGAYATIVLVPGQIHSDVLETTNVSPSDLATLEWAGSNLPDCSRVLVAPGSVGQFLPEYAHVSVLYPMTPPPVNLSYALVVRDLIAGQYTPQTRANLLLLTVSEVYVSGETSGAYAPFESGEFRASPDFQLLYENGASSVWAFVPGAAGCPFP